MRTLFFKIFVWFWLAMALVVLASTLSSLMAFNEGPRHLGGQLAVYGIGAAEKIASGTTAVEDYLRQVERLTRTRVYFFDDNAHLIAGREAPSNVTEITQALANTPGGQDRVTQSSRIDLVARRFIDSSGRAFIIAGEFPRPPSMVLPFRPHAWWLQSIAVFLTAGIFCYGLARYLTSPIVKLRDAARHLAAGDLAARVGAANRRRRDELADLGKDFDEMADRIQTLIDSQQRLLHDISHELRSPLARLKIALELARKEDAREAEWALDRIEREADRLDGLIGQLLTLARLDSNPPNRIASRVSLKRLLQEVVSDADFEANSRGRSVKVTIADECVVEGNEQLLRSAIENVIRNAASYTAEGTAVEVSLTTEPEAGTASGIIRVTDHGSGVPQAALSNIFRPFYRVDDARDRQTGGSGLGLSITQRAVQIHKGEVSASNATGGGLIVEIRLPVALETLALV